MPSNKKKRRTIFDAMFGDFFGADVFGEVDELFGGLRNAGAGYSMQVSQINGETVVTVKAYGQVDKKALEKELKEKYPNAKINIELYNEAGERKPVIEELASEEVTETSPDKETEQTSFPSQKSRIDLFKPSRRAMIEEIKNQDEENKNKNSKKKE